ncbi:MAG TPA: thiamine-phosphate kinase [Acidimicrobiales bacterium]|nr:MAG: thiamine-phosphate kinase [Actinobacteria bacterium 21-64-8]HQT98969.1 thiamine-phosphate kinase [Acidimicrobiales bacterium]
MNAPADPTNPLRELSQHEDDVLERIGKIVSERTIVRGERHVGDDAAVLRPFVGEAIVSTDVAVWGVHLDEQLFGIGDLGFKAVAAAVSDLAAMGARARGLVVAVVAPPGTDLEELHYGIAEAAQLTGCPVVGGDLSRGNQVSVAVTVLGECPGGGAVLRSGARAGDEFMVTGPLGASSAGLRRRRDGAPLNDELVLAHRRPWPRLREGIAARDAGASAMMDLSDGLGLDLHRLADASGVGFELTAVPVSEGANLDEAISGGEDYELVIATSNPERLRLVFHDRGLREPISLGRAVASPQRRLLGGEVFERKGFEHEL